MSQPTVTDECYFLEKLEENHYNTYQPQKHQEREWYVGLKKNGKPKLGPRTNVGQKAVFFLPRQLDDSGEWRCSSQHATNMKKKLLTDFHKYMSIWIRPRREGVWNGQRDAGLHYLMSRTRWSCLLLWCDAYLSGQKAAACLSRYRFYPKCIRAKTLCTSSSLSRPILISIPHRFIVQIADNLVCGHLLI